MTVKTPLYSNIISKPQFFQNNKKEIAFKALAVQQDYKIVQNSSNPINQINNYYLKPKNNFSKSQRFLEFKKSLDGLNFQENKDEVLKCINKDNFEIFETMAKTTYAPSYRVTFDLNDMLEINPFINKDNKNIILKLIKTKNNDKTAKYECSDLKEIVSLMTKNNKNELLKLIKLKADSNTIKKTLKSLNEINDYTNKIADKITTQLDITTTEDINAIINKLPTEDKKLALLLLQKNTQFASYKSLNNLIEQLNKLNIKNFCTQNKVNTTNTLQYIINCKTSLLKNGKIQSAFILDKDGINFLKDLKTNHPDAYKEVIANDYITYINLEGWNTGINLNNPDVDLSELTKSLLEKAKQFKKENPTITNKELVDKVTNGEVENAIQELGLKNVVKIQNETKNSLPKTISSQLEPLKIEKDVLTKKLDIIAKVLANGDKHLEMQYKKVALKYLDYQFEAYSPKRMANELKNIHQKVLEQTNNSFDDVYIFCPYFNKSNALITELYCNVNNIDYSKIIKYKEPLPSNAKTILILDDVIGSGRTMEQLHADAEKQNKNIIMSSIIACDSGLNYVKKEIKDAVLIETTVKEKLKKSKFYKNLKPHEKVLLTTLLNSTNSQPYGYDNCAMATVFPYMSPDNCSSFSTLFLEDFVITPEVIKNKATNDDIREKFDKI